MTKERLYTAIVSAASGAVVFISGLNLSEDISYVVTLCLYTIATIFTQKKNRLSVEINDAARKVTNYIVVLLIVGAVGDFVVSNHFTNLITINESTVQIIRSGIALLLLLMNNLSKTLFPSEEGKAIEEVKDQLKQTQKFKQ